MGNTLPYRIPASRLECFDTETGEFSFELYHLYRRRQQIEESSKELENIINHCCGIADFERDEILDAIAEEEAASKKKKRKKPQKRRQRRYRCPIDGTLKIYGPENTPWFDDYVLNPELDNDRFCEKFRWRFRMSYESFQKQLEEVKNHPLFKKWSDTATDCTGKKSSPIELLLLGVLRYLGRGWTLDDLEEATAISKESHRRFLHVYLHWGSTYFYEKYVWLPSSSSEIADSSYEFFIAGLAGCIGSQDATHVGMNKCHYKLKQFHDSFKLPMPSRTYNMTVNHRRRILSTTHGSPGRWNDKTLQLYDELSTKLRSGECYGDLKFFLWERDGNGGYKKVDYEGAWLVVDNGYLRWPTMVPPMKAYTTYSEMRFSRWVESMRKDVECTFGILKGRFRILKTGVS